jgi:hypothetical protein
VVTLDGSIFNTIGTRDIKPDGFERIADKSSMFHNCKILDYPLLAKLQWFFEKRLTFDGHSSKLKPLIFNGLKKKKVICR